MPRVRRSGSRFADHMYQTGKHWSAEKVANTFSAHPETKNTVIDWLVGSGIDRSRVSLSKGHNWVEFEGTVEEAERLFATEYWRYQHADSGAHRLACDEYSLPEHIRSHVDFAMPTIQLEGMTPVANLVRGGEELMQAFAAGASIGTFSCGRLITIDCLRKLYNFPALNTSAEGNAMGIGEWADYLYEPDLPLFFQNFVSETSLHYSLSASGGHSLTHSGSKPSHGCDW